MKLFSLILMCACDMHGGVPNISIQGSPMRHNHDLIERLCRSLACHVVENELTWSVTEPPSEVLGEQISEARALIEEAGYDFDELYPAEHRPTAYELA